MYSSLDPSVAIQIFSSDTRQEFLAFFLASHSSSGGHYTLAETQSGSISKYLPVSFATFFGSTTAGRSPSSLVTPIRLLSSSSVFSEVSTVSPLVSLGQSSCMAVSTESTMDDLLYAESGNEVYPTRPSNASASLPPFFLAAVLTSALQATS